MAEIRRDLADALIEVGTVLPVPDRELTEALLTELRRRIAEQNLKHQELADRASMAQPTLSRKLRGLGDFTVDELQELAVALGVNRAEELLEAARSHM